MNHPLPETVILKSKVMGLEKKLAACENRIDSLQNMVEHLSGIVNSLWFHPLMPGGEEQIKRARTMRDCDNILK